MKFWSLILTIALLFQGAMAHAEDGVGPDKIVFGQTAALTGPTAALGNGMRDGVMAAFREANDAGGVRGHRLELISLDDGYEPDQAAANTHQLIQNDKVFALIGGVGTPTANAVAPIITNAHVPFIGPFTGAQFLRLPFNRYIVNVRASYQQEAETLVRHITQNLRIGKIAVLYQDDAYGLAGLNGVRDALRKRNMTLVGRASYRRNTVAIKEAVIKIRDAAPQAIILVGAYKPCAAFIRLAKQLGVRAVYLSISFVGSEALARELGADGEGVIISQVVPIPFDANNPLVGAYQKALRLYDAQASYGFISLEGYIAGRLTVDVLEHMDGPITRDNFLNTLYRTGAMSLDGLKLAYGPDNNQGLDTVFLTRLDARGQFLPIEQLEVTAP